MKILPTFVAFLSLSLSAATLAQESKPLLHDHALPVIAAPDFKGPLDATWSIAHGKWTPENGVLDTLELPENKHAAVLHHNVGLESAVIECEFRFDGPGTFLIGCDGQNHVGRVVIKPTGMDIAEDSIKPSHVIATLNAPVKQGEWHHLRVEWQGDRMAASFARASIYLDRGAIDEAIVDCDEALRLQPDYDLGYLARARAYAHKRDWEKCLDDTDAALKIASSGWGHYLRGRALTARGEFDEAISEFDHALVLSPADTWAMVYRAENYAYRSEYSRALDDLRNATARFPGVAGPHDGLAWFLATCPNDAYRDGSQAIVEALKACDLSDWKEWWALDTLAAAYAENGEFDKAIRYANEALRLPNASPQERFVVEQRLAGYNYRIAMRDWPPSSLGHGPLEEAMAAYAKKNYDRAIARLNRILPPNPGASITARWFHFFDGSWGEHGFIPTAVADRHDQANAFYYRALAYEKKDELDNAIADFSTALFLEPDSPVCLRERGYAYYQKNAYPPALEDFSDALRRNPDDALTYCYRAETLNADHQRDAALEAVNIALRVDPKLGEGYYTRGWIYRAQKRYDLALVDFEKADWLEPNHRSTLLAKARTLAANGNYQTAAHEFRAIAQRFPKSAEARNALAWFLATCPERNGRNGAEAVTEARTACELSHWDNPSYVDTLAAAYAENGEFDQAVKYAMRAVEKLPASDPDRPQLVQHLDSFRRKEAWRSKADDQ